MIKLRQHLLCVYGTFVYALFKSPESSTLSFRGFREHTGERG